MLQFSAVKLVPELGSPSLHIPKPEMLPLHEVQKVFVQNSKLASEVPSLKLLSEKVAL